VTQAAAYMARESAQTPTELDAVALEACRTGDVAALRSFVLRYQQPVFAFLSRTLGAGSHVEDLAQETFIRALRALPSFDTAGRSRPSTWLLTIAARLAVDYRRKKRVPVQPIDDEHVAVSPHTPETERRRMEMGRALSRAARRLSDEQRDAFILAEFHGLDTKEIAAVLSIPEGTVKTRLFRARERLRALLEGVLEET
jgi:RNA polymerase sigma-70 factor (ECF subfamily)